MKKWGIRRKYYDVTAIIKLLKFGFCNKSYKSIKKLLTVTVGKLKERYVNDKVN